MTVTTIDTSTLVGLKAGADVYNDNFTDTANAAAALVQTSGTDLTTGRTLMTDSVDADGNVWGASNIEYGTNANGEFWKYPDGLLICTMEISIALAISNAMPGGFRSNSQNATFPEPFAAIPTTVCAPGGSLDTFGAAIYVPNNTVTKAGYVVLSPVSEGSLTREITFTAIGLWKI